MNVVIDIGCCTHEGDDSVSQLIADYQPSLLYGLDPLLDHAVTFKRGTTLTMLIPCAAWVDDSDVELGVGAGSPLDATVVRDKDDRGEWANTQTVRGTDIAKTVLSLKRGWMEPGDRLVMKMNAEGAEFPLLDHLIATGAIDAVDVLVISWHDERMSPEYTERRQVLEQKLSVRKITVEPWTIKAAVA